MGSDESAESTDVMELKELTAEIIQLKRDGVATAEILNKLVPEVASLTACKATISDHLIETNSKLDTLAAAQGSSNEQQDKAIAELEKANKSMVEMKEMYTKGKNFFEVSWGLGKWGGRLLVAAIFFLLGFVADIVASLIQAFKLLIAGQVESILTLSQFIG